MRYGPGHLRLQQRLSRRHQAAMYTSGVLLAASGLGWLVSHYLIGGPGGTGAGEVWWLRLHGAALIAFLVSVGAALPVHVVYGWRHRMNRGTGLVMLVGAAWLAVSGYGLYYLVSDALRAAAGLAHWIAGLALCPLMVLHVILGRRRARQSAPESAHAAQAAHAHHRSHHHPHVPR